MADTHEDPSRGDSSGSQAESKVEVGETTGRSEAFRSLIARGLQSSDSRISLETRLGVITITILVFTFGFLIYRKVELHQQRLAAQIPPQVTPDDDAQIREALDRPTTQLENADSEFASDSDSAFANGSTLVPNAPDQTGDQTEMVFEEPPVAPPDQFVTSDEPFSGSTEAFTGQNSFENTAALSTPTLNHEALDTEAPVSNGLTEVNLADSNLADSDPGERSPFESPFAESVIPESAIPESDGGNPPASADFDGVALNEPTPDSLSDSAPSFSFEDPTPAGNEPPVLIAMLDPQPGSQADTSVQAAPQENPFGPVEPELPAFGNPAASPVSDPAPFGDPAPMGDPAPFGDATPFGGAAPSPAFSLPDSEPSSPATEPVFDFSSEPTPMPSSPTLREVPESNPFGGEFRTERTVSPAVASGPDGKFSLAAFNYQNNLPAPVDDGKAYDIVTVLDGDNYSKISKRIYGTSRYFAALAVFNQHRISDPKKMRPGMKVLVPPATLLEERYPQLFQEAQAPRTRPAPGFFLDESGNPAYRVGARETLSEISERCLGRSSRWIEILRLNQNTVPDPNKLKPGTVLVLPDDAVEVNVSPQ